MSTKIFMSHKTSNGLVTLKNKRYRLTQWVLHTFRMSQTQILYTKNKNTYSNRKDIKKIIYSFAAKSWSQFVWFSTFLGVCFISLISSFLFIKPFHLFCFLILTSLNFPLFSLLFCFVLFRGQEKEEKKLAGALKLTVLQFLLQC